jgi:hypothetical protein
MKGVKRDRAVKIDSEIAAKIEKFISGKENRIRYSSVKQFIDIAVLEKLEKEADINEETIREKSINILKPEGSLLIKKEVKVPSGII